MHILDETEEEFYTRMNLLREHQEHEFGAQYDDVRERFASELADIKMNDRMEEEFWRDCTNAEELGMLTSDKDSNCYPCLDEYYAYIKNYWERLDEYSTRTYED